MKLWHLLWSPIGANENWAQTLVRVTGNLLRWVIGIPALAVAAIAAWFALQNWADSRPVKPKSIQVMNGLSVGMTKDEVTVAKGKPDLERPPEEDENGEVLHALLGYGSIWVLLAGPSEEELVVFRVCDRSSSYATEYNGVRNNMSEAAVIELLGRPDNEVIHEDKFGKNLRWNEWNMFIGFNGGRVDAICIGTQ